MGALGRPGVEQPDVAVGLPDHPVAAHLEVGWVAILSGLKTLLETGTPIFVPSP